MWYKHKNIHQITFEAPGRNIRSIIDYMTYSIKMRYVVKDVRVFRSAELSTEQRLLIIDVEYKKPRLQNFKSYKRIKIEELENDTKRHKYAEKISQILTDLQESYKVARIDEKWKLKEGTMLTEAELV
jgi:hypothetical protein